MRHASPSRNASLRHGSQILPLNRPGRVNFVRHCHAQQVRSRVRLALLVMVPWHPQIGQVPNTLLHLMNRFVIALPQTLAVQHGVDYLSHK